MASVNPHLYTPRDPVNDADIKDALTLRGVGLESIVVWSRRSLAEIREMREIQASL